MEETGVASGQCAGFVQPYQEYAVIGTFALLTPGKGTLVQIYLCVHFRPIILFFIQLHQIHS